MWRWPFARPIACRCSWPIAFAVWWPPCTPDGAAPPPRAAVAALDALRSRVRDQASRRGRGDRPEHRRRAATKWDRSWSMRSPPPATSVISSIDGSWRPAPPRGSRERPKLRLDVAGANRDQLVLAGVPEEQIHLVRPVHGDAPGRADVVSRGKRERGPTRGRHSSRRVSDHAAVHGECLRCACCSYGGRRSRRPHPSPRSRVDRRPVLNSRRTCSKVTRPIRRMSERASS